MSQQHREFDPDQFPSVAGVSVCVPRCAAALAAYLTDLGTVEARFASRTAALEGARGDLPTSMRRRADRMLAGIAHDLRLMKATCEPIVAAVADQPAEDDFVAWASIQTGLSLHDMFIYFYQDWAPSAEFDKVKLWFRQAVAEYCSTRASVAVLGAGACGLAYSLAEHFEHTYAVDLSLPTLLMAKNFIAGERLAVHLHQANWVLAELTPPPPPTRPLSFVAANAAHLPFADNSLSTVVTQCLFDIVDNPVHLAEEIQRVLSPNGIWLNFSHAFDAPGDPIELSPRKLEEVPLVLLPIGFDVVSLQKKRFAMLDATGIDPEPARTEDDVHFFAMRKATDRPPMVRFRGLRGRFESKDPSLWRARPRTIPGKEVSIARRRSFAASGAEEQVELRVGPYVMPIPEGHARLLAALLQQVDGASTLRTIFEELATEVPGLSEAEFLELVFCLSVERYLLDLQTG